MTPIYSLLFRKATLGLWIAGLGFACALADAGSESLALPETEEGLVGQGPVRRADWFEQLWLDRRTMWETTAEQDHGAVVFLGDSITQGWDGRLGLAFPGMKVANRGISGDTTRGLLIRYEKDVLALDPAGIVLLIGTNDLSAGATPEIIASDVGLLLEAFREHDATMPVLLCEVFPSSESKQRPSEKIQEINAFLRAEAAKFDEVRVVETFALFDDGTGDAMPELFPDLLHLNEAGYARWAAALRPILQDCGLLE